MTGIAKYFSRSMFIENTVWDMYNESDVDSCDESDHSYLST